MPIGGGGLSRLADEVEVPGSETSTDSRTNATQDYVVGAGPPQISASALASPGCSQSQVETPPHSEGEGSRTASPVPVLKVLEATKFVGRNEDEDVHRPRPQLGKLSEEFRMGTRVLASNEPTALPLGLSRSLGSVHIGGARISQQPVVSAGGR